MFYMMIHSKNNVILKSFEHGLDSFKGDVPIWLDVEDVEKIRQAVVDAADPANSPRRQLHQRNVQKKFCLERMATQYKLMYESVLASKSKRSQS